MDALDRIVRQVRLHGLYRISSDTVEQATAKLARYKAIEKAAEALAQTANFIAVNRQNFIQGDSDGVAEAAIDTLANEIEAYRKAKGGE